MSSIILENMRESASIRVHTSLTACQADTRLGCSMNSLGLDESVPEVTWAAPGTKSGIDNLDRFLLERLKLFGSKRNDPNVEACSDMSPWLKFGQVSAARCALEAKARWERKTQTLNTK